MKSPIGALAAAVLWMFAVTVQAAAQDVHSPFHEILETTVDGDRVRYDALRSTYRPQLDRYLNNLAKLDIARLPREQQLAAYINLYNATMIQAVLDRTAKDASWTPAANDFAVFKEPLVRLPEGKTITLNQLEHEIIRPQFKDPRVHAALNCAAVSCPPLLPRAYRAADLDQVLDENMRRFINDPSRNTIDHANRKLVLSKIFDWYADDFGGKDKLAAYISRYTERDVSGYDISFQEYDWSLNSAKSETD